MNKKEKAETKLEKVKGERGRERERKDKKRDDR